MTKRIFALCALALLVAAPASAQMVVGANGGATFLLRDDGETTEVADILTEVGYRFALDPNSKHIGELVGLYGAGIDSGQLGGMLYRHYFDLYQSNAVKPGFAFGGFALGSSDLNALSRTTLFVGGGILLDITPQDDDAVTAYAEVYTAASGDEATLVRFGIRASVN